MTDGDNAATVDGTAVDDIAVQEALRDNGYLTKDELALTEVDRSEKQTIELSVTVDVRDMDTESREAIARLAELYEDAFQEVVNKSSDYGWSFLTTGDKLTQSDGTPFDSPTRSQAFGLLHRQGDKRERLIKNVFGNGSQEVSDPPSQTAQEAANYYLLLSFILANPDLCAELSDL
jgi:hypothetical protein